MAQQSERKTDNQSYSLVITPKLHSAGFFQYSGACFNYHPNMELNVTVKYKQLGAFVTKYFDFVDSRSSINYSTVGLFGSVQVGPRLQVTPYVGYFFAQKHSLMDNGSDMWTGLVVRMSIGENFWIENTTLISNLLHHTSTASLANRLNATLMIGKFRTDAYTWYAHSMHTALHGVSAGFAVTSPEWAINRVVSVKGQVSVLQQISHERPAGAYERALLVSLIVPIDCSRRKDE